MVIRPVVAQDRAALWRILEPMVRAGETYALPRDWSETDALTFWLAPNHTVFVAVDGEEVLGTYFLRANQQGGGAHVCNCGYVTASWATGKGVAQAMCQHSLEVGKTKGFRAMQFNFVVSSNERAVALWQRLGFQTVGRVPAAFEHPRLGLVDALVMWRKLD